MIPATTDDCPMTEVCPAYDRDRGVCLVRSGDCEFAPVAAEPDQVVDSGAVELRPGDGIGSPPNAVPEGVGRGAGIGDCFAYALAKATGEPLLFKGDDFARTDIQVAS